MRPRGSCRNADRRVWRTVPTLAALLLATLPGVGHAGAGCPAPGATYRLATDPSGAQGEIRLSEDPARMAGMVMTLSLPGGHALQLEMIQGQGYGSTSAWPLPGGILPVTEDGDGFPLALFETGPDGRLLPYTPGIPFADSPAPAALLIVGLGPALWYDAPERIGIDPAIWYLQPCT